MNLSETEKALAPLAEALDEFGIPYYVGGSIASSFCGVARSTVDVDVIADLQIDDIGPFARRLAGEYYLVEDTIRRAVRQRESFNLIHLKTMMKVDVFVAGRSIHDRRALARKRVDTFEGSSKEYNFASPEDVILAKLDWFRKGGQASLQQWKDVLGVLQVQNDALDLLYLSAEARTLGISDLLERACAEASE
ncbi:MAG: hypothetical protein LLG01_07030 [Planctomycetaceae bacterium]|nr:hypothetical protein [Planctomycetaceae bacterium]